jgi:prephenate dehydrogenase
VHKHFEINDLETISIAGVGLLGGSLGLALRATGFRGKLIGIGRRLSSLRRARAADAVDEITCNPARGVAGAQLVLLCMPISQFEPILRAIAPALVPDTLVSDVASAKVEVMQLARKLLPRHACFIGSHPMAGSEKSGVEYARADLFDRATCIVTPPPSCPRERIDWMCRFWQLLGARTVVMDAARHDRLLGRISHLPHAVASALVALGVRDDAIDLAGPGFADTTRIAGGDASLWTDIFLANRRATAAAIDDLIAELRQFRKLLTRDDAKRIHAWLERCKKDRDQWIAHRYRKQVLPP